MRAEAGASFLQPMQATFLSDHSSNPLQARPSDVLNNRYLSIYTTALHGCQSVPSDEDELSVWPPQEQSLAQSTETEAGQRPKYVDLDADMSDDELALPRRDLTPPTTISPNKIFNEGHTPRNNELHEIQAGDEYAMEHDVDELDAFDGIYVEDDYEEDMGDDDEDQGGGGGGWGSPLTPLTPSSPFSSPQSSRPPSPDESKTLFARAEDEQAEIQTEMNSLYRAVPGLRGKYQLVDRLGTGTFSSVYKAVDLTYDECDNDPWLGHHPPESTAFYQSAGPGYKGRGGRGRKRKKRSLSLTTGNGEVEEEAADLDDDVNDYYYYYPPPPEDRKKVYVAIKRVYTTSSPDRVKNELKVLEICRGCRHTSQVITAFRHLDQVVIVLPYQRNMDFRDFYQNLHPEGIKCYFRCLFRALRDIHVRGIIHRDVKPANFLYNPFTGIGTLCDFGLASHMRTESTLGPCLHTPASDEHPHGRNCAGSDERRLQVKTAQKQARIKSTMLAEKVGYPDNDKRPISKANRAGTRGFRAPEVLFKCHSQTGAIDVWSAGIIFLCFLTGKFPIFNSNDDIEALMEIAVIVGKRNTERVATLHGRTFATNVPDLDTEGISWQDFAQKLNTDITVPRKYDMRYYPHNSKHRDGRRQSSSSFNATVPPRPLSMSSSSPSPHESSTAAAAAASSSSSSNNNNTAESSTTHDHHRNARYLNPPSVERHAKDMRNAFDLLESMLHPESTRRITPRDALYHPFLAEPPPPSSSSSLSSSLGGVNPVVDPSGGGGGGGDDSFVPHPPGEGACAKWHSRDEVTEQMFVTVWRRAAAPAPSSSSSVVVGGGADDDDDGLIVVGDLNDFHHETTVDGAGGRWMKDHVLCMPGQGIAIGNKPCEFHRGPLYNCE